MRIVFIENKFDYEKERNRSKNESVYVCYDWMTWDYLNKKGEKVLVFDDSVDRDEGRNLQVNRLDDLKFTWFLDKGGKDLSQFEGVSLTSACSLGMRRIIAVYFRLIVSLYHIIKTLRPESVVAYVTSPEEKVKSNIEFDLKVMVFRSLKEHFNFELTVYPSKGEEIGGFGPLNFNSGWLQVPLKTRIAGLLLEIIARTSRNFRDSKIPEILLVAGSPQRLIWKKWAEENRAKFRMGYSLGSPPKRKDLLKLALKGAAPLVLSRKKLTKKQIEQISNIRKNLQDLFKMKFWKDRFGYQGIDFSPIFAKMVQQVIFPVFNNLAETAVALEKALQKRKYSFIVVPDCISADSRLLLEVAAKLGTETYLWLHGFAPWYLYSDIFQKGPPVLKGLIVWGNHMVQGYHRVGVPKEFIYQLTPPFFERYLPIEDYGTNQMKRVLLLGCAPTRSHICAKEIVTGEYIVEIAKFLKSLGIEEIILKIHPGETARWYQEIVKRNKLDIIVRASGSFKEYVKWADFVIGPETTGTLETVMLGKNFYMIDLEELHNNGFADQVYFRIVHIARSISELKQMILNQLQQPRKKMIKETLDINGTTKPGDLYERFVNFFNYLTAKRKYGVFS